MSVMARVMAPILRVQVKRKLRDGSVADFRRAFNEAVFPAPPGTRIRPDTVDGVPGEWLSHPRARPNGLTLLYIHGGAFVACSPRTHRAATGGLARRGFNVFAVDYRLAPEHRYPAALDDVERAYRGLISSGTPASRIVVAGESAGGNLTLALLLRLRRTGGPLPAAVAAWSPVTDLAGGGASREENRRRDPMLSAAAIDQVPSLYLPPDVPVSTPEVSVINGDFAGMPPVLLHVGSTEVLRDDSVRFAAAARATGTTVDLTIFPGAPHAWQIFPILPEHRRSLNETARFLVYHARERERGSGPTATG